MRLSCTRIRPLAVALVALTAILSACGASSGGSGGSGGDTLLIGAPLALTGPIAAQAAEMNNSFKLYLSQHGNKLGGVKVDLRVEDSQGDPNVTVTKTRLLIQNDKVDLIVGGALAPESLAIRNLVIAANMAYVSPISSADDLTQRKASPLIARTNMTSSQPNMPFGQYAAQTLGYKRIAIITQDYAYGWESAGGFQYGFEKSGGTITTKVYVPLGTTDWAPYVSQLPTNVDAIYALPVGGGVASFVRAYGDAGLKGKIPLIGGPDLADEDALQAIGPEEIGVVQAADYNPNNPFTKPFADAYKAAYGIVPSYWGESTYTALEWIDKAISAYRQRTNASDAQIVSWVRSKPTDFINEMRGITLTDAARGPSTLDKYGNTTMDIYVIKVVDQGGVPVRTTIDTIPHVSQFWTVDPTTFLAQPVFSRSFPSS
jgi:branched-chain amino acid transport system substrate-binding protein